MNAIFKNQYPAICILSESKKIKYRGFIAVNYDQWDICKAACGLGEANKMPLYKFVKDALIRRFGSAFYEELDAAAEHLNDIKT